TPILSRPAEPAMYTRSEGRASFAGFNHRRGEGRTASITKLEGGAMNRTRWTLCAGLPVLTALFIADLAAQKVDTRNLLTGQAAFVDYHTMKPGTFRKITVSDLPKPFATESSRNNARVVPRPATAWPQAPAGFKVELYATGLEGPRQI